MSTMSRILILSSALAMSAGAALAQGTGGGTPPAPHRWERRGGGDGSGGFGWEGQPGRFGRGPGHGMRSPWMRHARRRLPGVRDAVARLLDHQTLLRLTPAQVNSIIAIDDKLHADNKPLVERLMAVRRTRRTSESDGSRVPIAPAERDSVMTLLRTMRENMWRAAAAADAVLTPEQLNVAGSLDPAGRRRRGGRVGNRD